MLIVVFSFNYASLNTVNRTKSFGCFETKKAEDKIGMFTSEVRVSGSPLSLIHKPMPFKNLQRGDINIRKPLYT